MKTREQIHKYKDKIETEILIGNSSNEYLSNKELFHILKTLVWVLENEE